MKDCKCNCGINNSYSEYKCNCCDCCNCEYCQEKKELEK